MRTDDSTDSAGGPPGRGENLALLYQGILTGIVRVQSGRQPIGDIPSFRKRMKDALKEIEREAVKLDYRSEDVTESNYAVVALLDETVHGSGDANRTQWSSLQSELFERAVAGDLFFERLEALLRRRDTPGLGDILEVYYLCLLLGYKGRYAIQEKGDLRAVVDEVRDRLEKIRGRNDTLSPSGLPPRKASQPIAAADRIGMQLRWAALAMLALTLVSWIGYRVLLGSSASDTRAAIEKSLVP